MNAFHLPPEILEQIFQYIPLGYHGQSDHHSICLACRSWYASAIKRLYHSPSIIGKNFDSFARTLCPSVNANVRRTELAFFVHKLDMSRLVHNGSKSLTARILGRVKSQLDIFIAPAATFSLLAFSALAKCRQLSILNLEHVIESIDAIQLLRTVGKLENLKILYLRMLWEAPRDSSKSKDGDLRFPPSLWHLKIRDMCEFGGAKLLYTAMQKSEITSLAITVGPQAIQYLYGSIEALTLEKLQVDIGPRPGTQEWWYCMMQTIPSMVGLCLELDHLSIPLHCFEPLARLLSSRSADEPYALSTIIIHPTSTEFSRQLCAEIAWDSFINSILNGCLQGLKQITVVSRKDTAHFLDMEQDFPGRLEELHLALVDENHENSGLYLEGH